MALKKKVAGLIVDRRGQANPACGPAPDARRRSWSSCIAQ